MELLQLVHPQKPTENIILSDEKLDVFPLISDGWVEAPPPGSLLDPSLPLLSEAPPLWGPWAVSARRPCLRLVCLGRGAAHSKRVLKADETTQEEMSKSAVRAPLRAFGDRRWV